MICPAVYACSRTPTAAIVDSQSLWAAADGVGRDGGKKVAGRKGQVVDCLGLLLVVLVTAASVQDRDAAMPLLREHHRRITLVWADGGYADSSTGARTRLRLALTIVKRTDDATGFVVLPRRLTGAATTWRDPTPWNQTTS